MRKRFSEIKNKQVYTTDGFIGRLSDLLIDDCNWFVRYLAVTADPSLSPKKNREFLIAPASIAEFKELDQSFKTILTTQKLMEGPPRNTDASISRSDEQQLVDYFGWPIYWFGREVQEQTTLRRNLPKTARQQNKAVSDSSNLRSAQQFSRYKILTNRVPAGFLHDMVINVDSWEVESVVAAPGSQIADGTTEFSASQVIRVDTINRQVDLNLSQSSRLMTTSTSKRPVTFQRPSSGGSSSSKR